MASNREDTPSICNLKKMHLTKMADANTPLEIDKYGSPKIDALQKWHTLQKNCGNGILKSSFFHSRVMELLLSCA